MLFTQSTNASKFVNPQFLVTPLSENRLLLVLSGVVITEFVCTQKADWHRDTLQIVLDNDIRRALASTGLPNPPAGFHMMFLAEQYATFGGLNSIFDKNAADNAGFAVDSFMPPFDGDSFRVLGMTMDVAVQDSDAILYRVGYQLTAVGQFVQVPNRVKR